MAFPKLVVFFVFSPLFANSRNRPVPASLRIPTHCAARSPRRRWGDVLRQLRQRAPGRNYSPRNGLRRWVAAAGRRANFRNRHLSYNRLKNKLMRRRQIRRKLKSGRRAPWGGGVRQLGQRRRRGRSVRNSMFFKPLSRAFPRLGRAATPRRLCPARPRRAFFANHDKSIICQKFPRRWGARAPAFVATLFYVNG